MKRLAKEIGNYWRKYYTKGLLEIEQLNEKERYLVVVLKDFEIIPPHVFLLKGYFYQIASYLLPQKNLKVETIEKDKKMVKFKISW